MKLLHEQVTITDAIFIKQSNEELKSFQQGYDFLSSCYYKLRETQDILEKLNKLPIIGYTYTEEQLAVSLDIFKEMLIDENLEALKTQLLLARQCLWKYVIWLKENSNSLSAYLLRQGIESSALSNEDLLALAYLLSLTKPTTKEDIDKFELLLTELYKRIVPDQLNNLLDYLVPNSDNSSLSLGIKQKLLQISELTREIQDVTCSHDFILSGYLGKARLLKQELTTDFWHKEIIVAIATLDLEIKKQFQKLTIEKDTVLQICTKLLHQNYNSIGDLEDGSILNLQKASNFIKNLDKMLAEDYETHQKELKQAARIFEVVYEANQELQTAEQVVKQTNKLIDNQTFVASKVKENKVQTIVETRRNVGVVEVEEQLAARIEEVTNLIKKSPNNNSVDLKYSKLNLTQTEINALLSQGNVLENALLVRQNALVRRLVALAAELQETFTFLSKKTGVITFEYSNSRNTINSLLEEFQNITNEIDSLYQQAQSINDTNLSINLISMRNKLTNIYQKAYQWVEILFSSGTNYSTVGISQSNFASNNM